MGLAEYRPVSALWLPNVALLNKFLSFYTVTPKLLLLTFLFFANILLIFANFEVLLAAKNYLCFALL